MRLTPAGSRKICLRLRVLEVPKNEQVFVGRDGCNGLHFSGRCILTKNQATMYQRNESLSALSCAMVTLGHWSVYWQSSNRRQILRLSAGVKRVSRWRPFRFLRISGIKFAQETLGWRLKWQRLVLFQGNNIPCICFCQC